MSEPGSISLQARLVHRINQTLSIDVSLDLGRETCILFGASGAGKTTLLRLIAGLSRPDAGQVLLDGKTLFDSTSHIDEPLRNRQIGMIFQDDRLFPHLSVAANVAFGLKGWKRALAHNRLAEVSALCGVEHLLSRMPEMLSGGERQRVGLARALAPRPRLLLCDEPVSALDLANRHTLLEQLRTVQQALAIPVLYVTHSPSEALALGSRLLLLESGRIVADGPPLDVFSKNGDLHVRADTWAGVRNVFPARVANHDAELAASSLALDGGPTLTVGSLEHPSGARVLVAVRADDILLSREHLNGLSARNQIEGVVERLVRHRTEAEVIVRTGELTWIVAVVEKSLEQLAISPGERIHLIIKARSCQILGPQAAPLTK